MEEGLYEDFEYDYSDYNIAGQEAIYKYILNNKNQELTLGIKVYDYSSLNSVQKMSAAKSIIQEALSSEGAEVGDPVEAMILIDRFIIYKQKEAVYLNIDRINELNDFQQISIEILAFLRSHLGNGINLADDTKLLLRTVFDLKQLHNTFDFESFIVNLETKLNRTGVRQLLLNLSNSQYKNWLNLKCPDMSPATRYKILNAKKSLNHIDEMNVLVDRLNQNNLKTIISTLDNHSVSTLANNNYLKAEANIQSLSTLEIVGNAVSLANLMFKYENGQFIQISDLLSCYNLGIWAITLVFDDYIESMTGDFNEYVFYQQGLTWNMFKEWNTIHRGNNGFPDQPIYFYYTDDPIKVNPSLMPTSIVIQDQNVANQIFGFTPLYIDYNARGRLIENFVKYNFINFEPIEQITIDE